MKIKTAFAVVLVLCLFAGYFVFSVTNESENQKADLIKIVARDMNIDPSEVKKENLMSLTSISISSNDLKTNILNLKNLKDYNNLETLYLTDLKIKNETYLIQLKKLKNLNLSGINLMLIKSPTLPTLVGLQLANCEFNNTDFIKNMSGLQTLSISQQSIQNKIIKFDIEDIIKMKNLKTILLTNIDIVNIDSLSSLKQLNSLGISNCKTSNLNFIKPLINLEYLRLDNNDIEDITNLESLKKLKYVYLEKNNITNISTLSSLDKIEELYLGTNPINDISHLSGLNRLRTLKLSHTNVSNISAIITLPEISIIDIRNSLVKSLEYLENYRKPLELYLIFEDIEDISILKSNEYLYISEEFIG